MGERMELWETKRWFCTYFMCCHFILHPITSHKTTIVQMTYDLLSPFVSTHTYYLGVQERISTNRKGEMSRAFIKKQKKQKKTKRHYH